MFALLNIGDKLLNFIDNYRSFSESVCSGVQHERRLSASFYTGYSFSESISCKSLGIFIFHVGCFFI